MHINHRFLMQKAIELSAESRILDYGCGGGHIVAEGRDRGLEIYGTDIFHGDGSGRAQAEAMGLYGNIVREMRDNLIPFPDNYFDMVFSNQVIEHVENLDLVLMEVDRVLKPGGAFINLFPTRQTIIEGHCHIPFIHYFPKRSRARYIYAAIWERFGLLRKRSVRTNKNWALYMSNWLDDYTFYRSTAQVLRCFERYFNSFFIEPEYIKFRLRANGHYMLASLVGFHAISVLASWAYRFLGGVVIEARKPLNSNKSSS